MNVKSIKFILALGSALLLSAPAMAADKGEIAVELSHQKFLKGADGKENYESAATAKPGDIIEYKAVYLSKGKGKARDVSANLPVPKGMEYLPGTARPAEVSASIDGKIFAPVPLKRKVKLASGKEELREVPYAEYRHLRWNLKDMPPGKSSTVSARMRVNSTEPAAAKP